MELMVALYARVSTERQAETQTIEQQIAAFQAYAAEQGWTIQPEQVYRDEGHSGARLDRPALDRLRDAVARGDVDTLLITSPDRLARRYAYQVWLLEELDRAGGRVVFLERPPSDDPQDALVIQIRGAVAEYERTVIADRMRRAGSSPGPRRPAAIASIPVRRATRPACASRSGRPRLSARSSPGMWRTA